MKRPPLPAQRTVLANLFDAAAPDVQPGKAADAQPAAPEVPPSGAVAAQQPIAADRPRPGTAADDASRGASKRPSRSTTTEPDGKAAEWTSSIRAQLVSRVTAGKRVRSTAETQARSTADVQQQKARSGSLRRPYVRQDGQETVHVTFSLPSDLARRLRVFTATLEPGERNEWAAQWLERGIGE